MGTAISWMSAAYNFVPVHIITVYLAPYHTKEVEESKNRLKHLVSSILDRVRTSRILVMGDFNHHRVEVTNFLQLKGLTPILPEGTSSHAGGSHLDQAFTNLELVEAQCHDVNFTNHKAIEFVIKMTRHSKDVDIRSMPTKTTMRNMRSEAISQQTIAELLELPHTTSNEARLIYNNRIRKEKVVKRWYV